MGMRKEPDRAADHPRRPVPGTRCSRTKREQIEELLCISLPSAHFSHPPLQELADRSRARMPLSALARRTDA
jgi:hypothetical protein